MGRPGKKKGKVKKMKKSPFAVKSGGNRKKRRKKVRRTLNVCSYRPVLIRAVLSIN